MLAPVRHRIYVLLFASLLPTAAHAAWTADVNVDAPVCMAVNGQDDAVAVSDGAGGTVVAWLDSRSGQAHVYVQRLDAHGDALWTPDGVVVADSSYCSELDAAPDGAGGIFVAWVDTRTASGVYVQHVDGTGTPQWLHAGIRPTTTTALERYPSVVADGEGGVYVAWQDYRVGWTYRIYAQRLDETGTNVWSINGRLASNGSDWSIVPRVCRAPSGDLVVAWHTGNLEGNCLNAADGSLRWSGTATIAAETVGSSTHWDMTSDGEGGFILAFLKNSDYVYATRVDSSGARVWPTDVPVGTVASSFPVAMIEDGAGGTFIGWRDTRSGLTGTIAVQHVDAAGDTLWPANGVVVSDTWNAYTGHDLCSDGAGGIIIEWHGVDGLRAQRVDASGAPSWMTDGVLVSSAWLDYYRINVVSDGIGGAIAVYTSHPNQGATDINAERIDGTGTPGDIVAVPFSTLTPGSDMSVFPNPFHAGATIAFLGTSADGNIHVNVLDVSGRRVRALTQRSHEGSTRIHWDGRDDVGRGVPPGVYFFQETRSRETVRVVRLR